MTQISLRAYTRELEGMIENGRAEEVVSHCQFILKTFPLHLETYRLLGKAFLEDRKFKEAADIFQRVLTAVPDDFVSHVGMSIIKDEDGKLDDAIWHMERAFEVQPSNPAINDELRKLYGRRDGKEPARIRLTRDALANMYIQGALYGQAITEIKSIQAEDRNRTDLDVMLARAYFLDGRKNQAMDVCTNLLRRQPYCLAALQILIELIPNGEKQEIIQSYRQRVFALDPYTQFTGGSILAPEKAPDDSVIMDHLEYDPLMHPIEDQAAWESALGIQPDAEIASATAESLTGGQGLPAKQPGEAFAAETTPQAALEKGAEVAIPDWMLSSGWQQAEPGSSSQEAATIDAVDSLPDEPLAKAEIPDWLKEMVPEGQEQPGEQPDQREPSDLMPQSEPGDAFPQDQMESPAQLPPAIFSEDEIPDWLKESMPPDSELGSGVSSKLEDASMDEVPDWLKEFSAEQSLPENEKLESMPESESELEPFQTGLKPVESQESGLADADLQVLSGENQMDEMEISATVTPDETEAAQKGDFSSWLSEARSISNQQEPAETGEEDLPDWLKPVVSEESEPLAEINVTPEAQSDESNTTEQSAAEEISAESVSPFSHEFSATERAPVELPISEETGGEILNLEFNETSTGQESGGMQFTRISEEDSRSGLAWLEGLAAREGANPDELITHPDERQEVPPDWVTLSAGEIPIQPAVESEIVQTSGTGPDSELMADHGSLGSLQEEPNKSDLFLDGILAVREPEEQTSGPQETDQGLPQEKLASEQEIKADQTLSAEPMEAQQTTDLPGMAATPSDNHPWVLESETGAQDENQLTPGSTSFENHAPDIQEPEIMGYGPDKEADLGNAQPITPDDWQPLSHSESDPGIEQLMVSPAASEVTPASSMTPELKPDSLESALSLIESGEVKPGIQVFNRLVRRGQSLPDLLEKIQDLSVKYPDNFEIWQLLGDGYLRNNQLQKAMEAYSRAEELLH